MNGGPWKKLITCKCEIQSIQVYKRKINVRRHTAWRLPVIKKTQSPFAIKKEIKNFVRKTTNIFQNYLKLETVLKNLRTSEHFKASIFGVCSVITDAVADAAP